MNKTMLIKKSFIRALGVALYVVLVSVFMSNVQWIFAGHKDSVVAPISVLLLFVTSAAITASLVLGKPVMLYLDGQKKEAVKLFGYTVGWLFVFTIMALAANLLF